MRKRIIALLLALILTVGLLPTVALAAGETANTDVKSGSIGTDGKWSQTPPTQPKVDGVKTVDKTAEKVAGTDNQYKVTLTVVLEQTKEEQKPGAAATVLVLDTSGSMAYCAECGAEDDCVHNYVSVPGKLSKKETYYYKYTNENGQVRFGEAYYCDGKHTARFWLKHPAGWFTTSSDSLDHKPTRDSLAGQTMYVKSETPRTSRLDAAKVAAVNFLKTYSGLKFNPDGTIAANQTDRDLGRFVSVVTFETGVTLQRDWIDVSNPAGYKSVLGVFTGNSLKAKGATNLDAGLTYAEYLLKKNTMKDAAKNVIALTDGEPTYYLSTSYFCNDPECDGVDNRPQIGEEFYYVHGRGDACSTNTKSATDNAANALKNNNFSDLYTICFGVANDKMKQYKDGNSIKYWPNSLTVGQYLQSIASSKAGKQFAYTADNAAQLNTAFAAITDTIVSGLDTGTVRDKLPTAGITAKNASGEEIEIPETWDLEKDFEKKTEPPTTTGDKKVTTYTYTKTYYVTIDPDAVGLNTTKIGNDLYAPLNGETTLTVEVAGEEKNIPFPIPAGKVTPTTFTVTWKSQDGNTELEKDENVAKNSKPSYDGATPTKPEDDMYTYTFVGWALSDGQKTGTSAADLPNVTADVTYYAAFSEQLKQYTVTGTIDNNGAVTGSGQKVNAGGSSAAMTFTPAAGYEIKTITEKIGDGQPATITVTDKNSYTYPAKDNVKADIKVTVTTQKRTDLSYTIKYVEKGTTNEIMASTTVDNQEFGAEIVTSTITAPEIAGFGYDSCTPNTLTIGADVNQNVITLYYTRNKYKVTYTYTGSVPQGLQPPTETEYDFGASVMIANAPDAVPGYTFEGWKRGTEDATNFSMPAENVTITGNWTKNADAGYTIEYYLESLDGQSFVIDDTLTVNDKTGTIGTTASVTEADKKQITGFTFDANNTNNKLEGEIVSGDPLTLKLYYTRNSYTVKYEYTGTVIPQNATELPPNATYKYGAEVTVAAAATSADYVFSGWSRTGTFYMPAEDVIITGSWTQATYDVNLSPYVKKTLEVDGTLPSSFTFEVNVTVDGTLLQQKGSVTMTAADTSSFNMPTVALTAGTHTIMVQEVVDEQTKNSNIAYDTNQKTFVLNIPTSGAAAPVQYGTTDAEGNFVEVKEPAFVTITNTYTEPKEPSVVSKTVVTTDMVDTLLTSVSNDIAVFKSINEVDILYPVVNGEASTLEVPYGTKSITLLYKITVNAGTKTSMQFEDVGAERVSIVDDDDVDVSQVKDTFTVQFYRGVTTADIYVAKTYTNLVFDSNGECTVENAIGNVKATTTVKEKDPNKLYINFADFVKKELTATGTKTASDVDFTVDVKEFKTVISSIQGEEEVNTYAGEQLLSTTLNAHFDSITGGETKTAPFNGSIVVEHAGTYSFELTEEDGQRTGVTYDDSTYKVYVYVKREGDKLVVGSFDIYKDGWSVAGETITFHNTIDTGKDDYYPIIIPTIINKDTGMLNKTDHFAYVIGYPDGTVHPNGQITRAEVATIFFRLLRDEVRDGAFTTSNSYSDVAYGKWYNNPISTMSALGIITGYPDGTFKPNKPITRAEFAAIAARFDETQSGKSATFSDVIGHWAAKEIGIAYYNDWIKGYPDGTFKPDQNITRAEAMTLINRVLERKPESPADLLTNMNKWTDNMDTSKWYYLDVQEATNSHGYTRKTFNYELWRQMLPDPDWSRYER